MPSKQDKSSSSSKWGQKEKNEWKAQQLIQRSYNDEVITRIQSLKEILSVNTYGALPYDVEKYPLFVIKTLSWHESKPTILITGGVHGYETSGVHGALRFMETQAINYSQYFNIVCAPCVSPWGYETINRWNPDTIDPNRSFYKESPSQEAAQLMKMAASLGIGTNSNHNCKFDLLAHFDLHETTDTDNTVFRPALSARDGIEQDIWDIPDGFYLVGDSENPVDEFQKAIIDSVKKVTHIAPNDRNGKIIGESITQEGVINYQTRKLGLCTGFSNSQYCTTTEMYPDSPKVNDEDCILAQVAAIVGGLDYLITRI
ncbi:M14 family metallopeptidase [Agarilytica rhodophyticola]|uniref:M14 family metallopeptidase n=1 Tax=Agarilytica rhodophyticola TaxID=1737490 RepID=UPI000B3450E8|nr:M14 family metallocarboxypeptidase [Agarilytica rhodophyticola]